MTTSPPSMANSPGFLQDVGENTTLWINNNSRILLPENSGSVLDITTSSPLLANDHSGFLKDVENSSIWITTGGSILDTTTSYPLANNSGFLPDVENASRWISTGVSSLDLFTSSPLANSSGFLKDVENASLWMNHSDSGSAPHLCAYFQFTMRVVLVLTLCVCGLFSNLLTVWVYWSDRGHPVPLLISLISVLDAVLLVGVSLQMLVPGILAMHPQLTGSQYYMGHVQPVIVTYMRAGLGWTHLSNTWFIVLVTLYRYIAVCHPLKQEVFKSSRHTRLQIAAILVLSCLYYIPVFTRFQRRPLPDGGDGFQVLTLHSPLFSLLYYNIFYYSILYIFPFSALLAMTARIVCSLRRLRLKKETMTRRKRDDLDTTRMLLVVAGFFMLLQLPVPTIRLIRVAYSLQGDGPCHSWTAYYFSVARLLLIVNSSINGLIYYGFSKSFRRKVKARLCCRNKVTDVSTVTASTAQTTTRY